MRLIRTPLLLALVPVALAACGATATSTPSASPSAAAASSPAPASPGAPASAAAAAPVVKVGAVTVGAGTMTVLTDDTGLPLYYRTGEMSTSITCTGGCASNWPPVLFANGTPTGTADVTGTLSTVSGPNGIQVLYNGHPLYRWFQDAAGKATGDGKGGFKLATPGLAAG